jgi:hypothetical protein
MKFDEELAELVGAFIGDGFIGKYSSHYHVEFTGHIKRDRNYFTFLSNIIKSHFNVMPRSRTHEGALRLLVTYKELYYFFQ